MLILVTSEKIWPDEHTLLKEILVSDLVLHVRKPGISDSELSNWLELFEAEQTTKMVLHQHHQMAEKFPVKGIHLTESNRMKLGDSLTEYVQSAKEKHLAVSTSFHDKDSLKQYSIFDYCFLSPIYKSVSKAGYSGKNFQVNDLHQKVIALGGITSDKFRSIKKAGFSGGAVLGAVWETSNPIAAFQKIQQAYKLNFNKK